MTDPGGQRPRSATYTLDHPGAAVLDVELPAGRVEVVRRNHSYDFVTVKVTEVETGGRPFEPDAITIGAADGLFIVHAPGMKKKVAAPESDDEITSPDIGDEVPPPRLDVRITVPSTMSARIRTNSADISVARLKDVTADTESGTITVSRADGDVRVVGGTAPLAIGSVAGELDATSVGPIEVGAVSGYARIMTDGEAKLDRPSKDWGYDVTSETSVVVNGRRDTATAEQPARLSDSGAKTLDPGDRILAERRALLESLAVERTFPASGEGPFQIDADLDTRRLRVTGSRDATDYTVRITPSSVSTEAIAALGDFITELAPSGEDGTRLVVHGLQGGSSSNRPDAVEIIGPVGIDVLSATPDAVVRLGGTVGSVEVTTGGRVHMNDATGDVTVRAGGDVSAKRVGGGLGVVSGGTVSARSVAGPVYVEADHGATVDQIVGDHEYDVRSKRDIGQVRVGSTVATPDGNGVLRLTGAGPVSSGPEPAKSPSRRSLAVAVGGSEQGLNSGSDGAADKRRPEERERIGGPDLRRHNGHPGRKTR